jgi:hypothetical protein
MEVNGQTIRVSASTSPIILEQFQIGFTMNAEMKDSKLVMEAWINPTQAAKSDEGRAILSQAKNGDILEVSTGLFCDEQPEQGYHQNEQYFSVWRGVVPDHLAILLPGHTGACSVADGCGANVTVNKAATEGFRVHRLNTSCGCGGCMSTPNASGSPPIVPTPVGDTALSFNMSEFMAHLMPDGIMDSDVRSMLQCALDEQYKGAYTYLIGFTNKYAVFSSYDTIAQERYTYQASYDVDKSTKKAKIKNDKKQVVLTTAITVSEPNPSSAVTTRQPQDQEAQVQPNGTHQEENAMTTPTTPGTTPATSVPTIPPVNANAAAAPVTTPVSTPAQTTTSVVVSSPAEANLSAQAAQTPVVQAQPPQQPVTLESFLANAPAEIRETLQRGVQMQAAQKLQLITALKATGRCKFNDQQLNGMDITMLESLVDLAHPGNDYSGVAPAGSSQMMQQAANLTVNEGDQAFAPPPPRLGATNAQQLRSASAAPAPGTTQAA